MINGHLKVLPMELDDLLMISRNSSGHIVEMTGVLPLILDWLQLNLNFSYTLVDVDAPLPDDSSTGRGAISYILSGEADFLLGGIVPTPSRFRRIDYTASWMEAPLSILIKIPEPSTNMAALIQPFQPLVWYLLLASLVLTAFVLYVVSRLILKSSDQPPRAFEQFSAAIQYVVAAVVESGFNCRETRFAIRSVASAWALLSFVVVMSYSSTLISYVSSPNRNPIIESVEDIPKVPGLQIVVDKGYTIEYVILKAKKGYLKPLGDILRNNREELTCVTLQGCLDKVKSGPYVYIQGAPIVQGIVNKDRKDTGVCHFTIAKKSFANMPIFMGLPKNSPLAGDINSGIMRMRESGLLYYWTDLFIPPPTECLNSYREKPDRPRLTMMNLTCAFIILAIGYPASLIAFILENIMGRFKRCHRAASH